MADRPTKCQAKALIFISEFIAQHRCAPTFDEIGVHLGTGKQAAFELVERIIDAGWLTKVADRERSLALTPEATAWYDKGHTQGQSASVQEYLR